MPPKQKTAAEKAALVDATKDAAKNLRRATNRRTELAALLKASMLEEARALKEFQKAQTVLTTEAKGDE